jgi:hypothetical protein
MKKFGKGETPADPRSRKLLIQRGSAGASPSPSLRGTRPGGSNVNQGSSPYSCSPDEQPRTRASTTTRAICVSGLRQELAKVSGVKPAQAHSAEGPATATRFSVFVEPAINSTRFPAFSISFKYETSLSAPAS